MVSSPRGSGGGRAGWDPACPQAWAAVGLMAGVAAGLAARGAWLLALAPALAGLAHGWELAAMRLETRLRVVGLRAMSLSIGYAALVVTALRMRG